MKGFKIIIVLIFMFSLAFLCSCSKDNQEEKEPEVKYSMDEFKEFTVESIHAYENKGDGKLTVKVAEDITLLDTNKDVSGTKLTWKSLNSEYINDNGKIVKRPDEDLDVAFECTLEFNGQSEKLDFNFKLSKMSLSDALDAYKELFPDFVSNDLSIKNDSEVVDLAWTSSNEEVLSNEGKFRKPSSDTDITISFIVSDTNNRLEGEKVIVGNGKSDLEIFEECQEWIRIEGFKESYLENDVKLPNNYKGVVNITWSSYNTDIIENDGKIHRTYFDRYAYIKCNMSVGEHSSEIRFYVKVLALPTEGVALKDIVTEFVKTMAPETVSKLEFTKYPNINQYFGFLPFYQKANSNITEYIAPVSDQNRPGTLKPSIEYITVHDTANNSKGAHALAHAKYVSQGGGGTSWSYTVDENGVYHQIPDNEVSYHAGDGTRFFALMDTGIKATVLMPQIYMKNGNFYILGQDTHIRPFADKEATTFVETDYTTNDMGQMSIICEIGENGNYFIGRTYFNTTYNYVSNYGGNRNSIGIETCVDSGSDYGHTYRNVAKLCAELVIQNNLSTDRVKGHHFFSGKPCPNAILTEEVWADFLTLVSMERFAKEYLSECTFTYRALTNNIDTKGYIKLDVKAGDEIEYKIQVNKGDEKLLAGTYKTIVE